MRLAAAVRPDDADALAEVDLLAERQDEAVDLDVLEGEYAARRVGTAHTHLDLLRRHRRRGRTGVGEPAPARFRRIGLLRPHVGVSRALLERPHELAQPLLLVL